MEFSDLLSRVNEANVNITLAELLAEGGLKALGEVLGPSRARPDILLKFNGATVIIEGKKLGGWSELEKQCNKRLDDGECDICVMVEYLKLETQSLHPDQADVKEAIRRGRFNVGVRTMLDRVNLEKWGLKVQKMQEKYEDVSFDQLAWLIHNAYERLVNTDLLSAVVERIGEAVEGFAEDLEGEADVERMKTVLELMEKDEDGGAEPG